MREPEEDTQSGTSREEMTQEQLAHSSERRGGA